MYSFLVTEIAVNLKEHSLSQEINMKTHSGQTPF